jgi:hypothetical protein
MLLKANYWPTLRLDAKVVRKIPNLERRVTNIEEQEGIEKPREALIFVSPVELGLTCHLCTS